MFRDLIVYAILPTLATAVTWYIIARRINHISKDVHKPGEPKIPESGGIAIRIGSLVYLTYLYFTLGDERLIRFMLTIFALGLVGLYDDFRPLKAKEKFLLTLLAGMPAVGSGINTLYTPLGKVRLENLYRVGIPTGYSVYANAVNMMDTVNMATLIGVTLTFAIQALFAKLLGIQEAFLLALGFLLITLVYLPFNAYPAHMFNGDVGDLTLGGLIFTVALYGHLEVITLIATIPLITNGMIFVLTYGIKTRTQYDNPTVVGKDGKIYPNESPKAANTLLKSIVSIACGANEKEIIKYYIFFFILSAIASLMVGVMYL